MPAVCKHAWIEPVQMDEGGHSYNLHHKCIAAEGHESLDKPTPHRCSCDPVMQLHVDYTPEWED